MARSVPQGLELDEGPAGFAADYKAQNATAIDGMQLRHRRFDSVMVTLSVAEAALREAWDEIDQLRDANGRLADALVHARLHIGRTQHLAHHDSLTGLPNRYLLLQRLQQGIEDAFQRQENLALMFIDLDGFKDVNDLHGHQVGDKLLTVVASRLAASVRDDDLACRYGGDEFVVILPGIRDYSTAHGVAEKLRANIEGQYNVNGKTLQIRASIGLAQYPVDGNHCEALLRSADQLMYLDKHQRLTDSDRQPPGPMCANRPTHVATAGKPVKSNSPHPPG